MNSRPTCVFDTLDLNNLLLVVGLHTQVDPRPEEWNAALSRLKAHIQRKGSKTENHRHLVLSDGGAPNAAQRRQMMEQVWGGVPGKVAVITHRLSGELFSPARRGVLTALTWLNPNIRFHLPSDFMKAIEYLELEAHLPQILSSMGRLSQLVPSNRTWQLICEQRER